MPQSGHWFCASRYFRRVSGNCKWAPDKVLIVVTSHSELGTTKKTGYFLSEVTHLYYVLTKAGYEADIASPNGGLPPIDELATNYQTDGNYLVANRKVSTFTNMEERIVRLYSQMPFLLETTLKERGAMIEKSLPFMKKATVDGRLVTGQNPNSARELGVQIVKLLDA